MSGQTIHNHNIGYLCTDLAVKQGYGEKVALLWVSSTQETRKFSYRDLMQLSNRAANVLQDCGVSRGDHVMILLPKVPELYTFFLGCLKLGANVCILFSSIGEDALTERVLDTNTTAIVSNSSFNFRLNKIIPRLGRGLKILLIDEDVDTGSVTGVRSNFTTAEDKFETPATPVYQRSHFHFTSGSTGRPKGVQHVHGAAENHLASFNDVMQADDNDIYWCTADPGWVTGVTYGIIAPWLRGLTQIQAEGNYNPETWMKIIEKFQVNVWYTAPTVFRMLMQMDAKFFSQFTFSSLKRIYCVGEPLNPALVQWGRTTFGCEIYDTWFQTETGSIMISNRPGLEVRPGSMGKPLPYIDAQILNGDGSIQLANEQGLLCIKRPWASMLTEYINNPQAYQKKFINDYYSSGDIAYRDQDGYFWFVGRNDDVINTAGHLVSPFEVESALIELSIVSDVAAVGVPDPILFEKVVAFVVLKEPGGNRRAAEMEIKLHVSKKVSSIAAPKEVVFVTKVPKTKSGKIMRRVLKKQYLQEDVGDLSTMEEE